MLFQEILDEKYKALWPSFKKLYELSIANQTHEGDLLLVILNAFHNPEVHDWDNLSEKLMPYMFGPNHEGHSEDTHTHFIGDYVRKNISPVSQKEHLENVKFSKDRIKEIDKINGDESLSIQTEMLIYLKIWESNLFIKKFYQLATLVEGIPYNWHFKISLSNRDKSSTGTRDTIIRTKIRDKFETTIPELYEVFKKSYKSQIRNSIAHSQYSILGRHIHLNNHVAGDYNSQLKVVSFEEWTEIFHNTIALHALYYEFSHRVNEDYG